MLSRRARITILILLLVSIWLSGCYYNAPIQANEVGLKITSGKLEKIFGPGRQSDLGFYTNLVTVNVSAQTVTWSDPDLVTKDKQPIGIELTVTYARSRDHETMRRMWEIYNAEAKDDAMLAAQVLTRIPRVAKAVTTKYTLDEMLGVSGTAGREIVTGDLFSLLEPELAEFGVALLDIGINNIAPDQAYLDLLKQKANAQVAVEVAKEETKKLKEQLEQEKAQTEIELEKARRQNQVNEELAKTFKQSQEYFELEKLKLLQGIFGPQDKVIFLPQGTDLSLFLSGENIVPVRDND